MKNTVLERVLTACVLLFLAVTSVATLLVTGYLYDYTEVVYREFAAAPFVCAGCAAVALTVTFLYRKGILDRIDEKKLRIALALYALIFGTVWAYVLAKAWPEWDSREVLRWGHATGDWVGSLDQGGYMYRFPYQLVYGTIARIADIVSFRNAYVALEGVNILFTAWMYYLIPAYTQELFGNKCITVTVTLFCFFYLAPLFNVTFVYPNIMALTFAIFALYLQVRALHTNSMKYHLAAAAAAWVSYYLKSSMLLLVAAMVVVWLLNVLRIRSVRVLLPIAMYVVLHIAGNHALILYADKVWDMDATKGMPGIAYVSMGLSHEGANAGWYDWFLWKYEGEEYTPERYVEAARGRIADRLDEFASDPAYALNFFTEKYLTEWTEPTHEALLSSNWAHSSNWEERPSMTMRDMGPLTKAVYYGPLHDALVFIMDVAQSVIMVFSLVYVWAYRKSIDLASYSPLLCAAGTALFYLVWEAKSQYVFHAYVMLIPFAAAGLMFVAQRVIRYMDEGKVGVREHG